jgi:hypothetical protein
MEESLSQKIVQENCFPWLTSIGKFFRQSGKWIVPIPGCPITTTAFRDPSRLSTKVCATLYSFLINASPSRRKRGSPCSTSDVVGNSTSTGSEPRTTFTILTGSFCDTHNRSQNFLSWSISSGAGEHHSARRHFTDMHLPPRAVFCRGSPRSAICRGSPRSAIRRGSPRSAIRRGSLIGRNILRREKIQYRNAIKAFSERTIYNRAAADQHKAG